MSEKPSRCQKTKSAAPPDPAAPIRRLTLEDLRKEPYRLFFPAAVLVGLLGVAQWPLHFGGHMAMYPGMTHSRLMAFGFFGGFIAGFLGTAGPRLLSARPLRALELFLLLALHLGMAVCFIAGKVVAGEMVLIAWLVCLFGVGVSHFIIRKDLPPPGFVLFPIAFACAIGGASISVLESRGEVDFFWLQLRPLIAFQGFLLLPMMGVGGFLLPRFLQLPCHDDFPESRTPQPGWWKRAWISLAAGLAIVGSFFLEASGQFRLAYAIRFVAISGYIFYLLPGIWRRLRRDAIVFGIKFGLLSIPLGYLTLTLFPAWRIAWLHLALAGGLGLVTLSIASRVVLRHAGRNDILMGQKGWFIIAIVMLLFGVTSRMIGDFIPKILVTHYNYGALCWGIGLLVWAWKVIPKVLTRDPDP